jgi:molecular chaperone DnaK (HSP70)
MTKIVDIDSGATNSVCAVMEASELTVIPGAEGGRLFPSGVAFGGAVSRSRGMRTRSRDCIRTISSWRPRRMSCMHPSSDSEKGAE